MNFKFELFGFCIDKDFDIKSFWFGAFTFFALNDLNEKDWTFLLIGKMQGKWGMELFGKWLFGPKEVFLKDKP